MQHSDDNDTLKTPIKSKAPAVDMSVQIMDVVATSPYPLTLSEICNEIGIPAASGHRVINALLAHEMIAHDANRKKAYCIGSKIFQIASTIYNKQSIIPFFYPVAEILKNEIHKSIYLYSAVGNNVVSVAKVDFTSGGVPSYHIGQTLPMHASAAGIAMLSMANSTQQQNYLESFKRIETQSLQIERTIQEALTRAKRLGYAVTQKENDKPLCCIAAPVLNLRNEPIAAISAGYQFRNIKRTVGQTLFEKYCAGGATTIGTHHLIPFTLFDLSICIR